MCRKMICFIFFVLVLGLATTSAGQDIAEGLVAHWLLNEGSGTTTADASGNGNDGTLNAPTWDAGKFGGALNFDGVDDFVDCGNPSILNFGMGSWTVSAWVNAPSSTNQMNVFSNGGDYSGGIRYMLGVSETDARKACLTLDNNVKKVQSTGSITVNDGQWHHIVGIRDGSSLRIYVDGFQDGDDVALPNGYDLSGTSQANAYIGAGWNYRDSVVQRFFNGVIDDVRIYNYALSSAEVRWLSGATLPVDEPF